MTQSELCDGRITRNMLSSIENGSALPSLDTLLFLASRLELPAGYFIDSDFDLKLYSKLRAQSRARELYSENNYRECTKVIKDNELYDDEGCYLLAYSQFYVGLECFSGGSLASARSAFTDALTYAEKTVYDTERIDIASPLYIAICNNVSLPLLDFDADSFLAEISDAPHLELYKYISGDATYPYKNKQYSLHLEAKRLIKERRYSEAAELLGSIEANRRSYPPSPYVIFGVYADLELCYKNILDFERAYRYASKRISLIEGFST